MPTENVVLMYVTTIKETKGPESEREQGVSTWREERKRRNDVIISSKYSDHYCFIEVKIIFINKLEYM